MTMDAAVSSSTRLPFGDYFPNLTPAAVSNVLQCIGIAEFATLLKHVKARIPSETRVVVTLNGDFLWRSELNRKDKG